jgi:stage V sporulation protein G
VPEELLMSRLITEVGLKPVEQPEDRLLSFCSITILDKIVIRDLKIIEGNNGLFVAMPSRRLTFHCHKCHAKNHLRANFCNHCGTRFSKSPEREKLYSDVAHPINRKAREEVNEAVLGEFENSENLTLR